MRCADRRALRSPHGSTRSTTPASWGCGASFTSTDALSQQPQLRAHLRLLPERDLTFDLCVLARQLPLALDLVTACPDVAFVLDHCGAPDIAAGALDPWRDNLRAIASCANVTCKISGLLANCDPLDSTADAVRPYVEHAIEVFGWERVIWGSDWPVVEITSTLRDWADRPGQSSAGESEENRRKLFTENAIRVSTGSSAAEPVSGQIQPDVVLGERRRRSTELVTYASWESWSF